MPSTCIVIPIWDSDRQSDYSINITADILDSIDSDSMLVIVDNNSPSVHTQAFLKRTDDPRFFVIHNDTNRGYGNAANQGVELGLAYGCKNFVIMNNDIFIVDPNWLFLLLAPLKENPKRLVGARLVDFNSATAYDGTNIVPYLEGWCLAFTSQFVADVGIFDPMLWLWHEDVELSLRAVRAGYELHQAECFEWANRGLIPIRYPLFHASGKTGFAEMGDKFASISEESRKYVATKWFG